MAEDNANDLAHDAEGEKVIRDAIKKLFESQPKDRWMAARFPTSPTRTYGDYEVNVLHRTLMAERAIDNLCWKYYSCHLWEKPLGDTGVGGDDFEIDFRELKDRPPVSPSFDRCLGGCGDEYTVFPGDIKYSSFGGGFGEGNEYLRMWLEYAKSLGETTLREEKGMDQNSVDRINNGLLPVVWIFDEHGEDHGSGDPIEFCLGFGGEEVADQVVYSWSSCLVDPDEMPPDELSLPWSKEDLPSDLPKGLMALFCTGLGNAACIGEVNSVLTRFAWLIAHGLVSIDDTAAQWKEHLEYRCYSEVATRGEIAFARAAFRGKILLAKPLDYFRTEG